MRLLRERFPFINPMTDPKRGQPDKPPGKQEGQISDEKRRKREQRAEEHARDRANEMKDVGPADFQRCLRRLFDLVRALRNATVHPTTVNEDPPTLTAKGYKDLYFGLAKVYDDGLRVVATRFGLAAKTIEPFLRKDNHGQPKPCGAFPLAIGTEPQVSREGRQDAPLRVAEVLHDFGLVLLCALFLDKRQSAELISYFWQAGYAKDWDEGQRSIVKELIAVYRVRLPLQRLRSDESATAITLDTLSELSRCPSVLFEALGEEDRNGFRIGDYPGEEPNGTPIDGDDPAASYLMVRRRDRFVTLMMRLIDLDADTRLRFAIDLGQYFFNVRLKPGEAFTDGRPRVRRLARKVVAYGRLRDFLEANKPAVWHQLEANCLTYCEDAKRAEALVGSEVLPLKPYIVPTEPHYHYYDDKIGVRLADAVRDAASYPDPESALAEANTDRCRLEGTEMEPDFWLSPAQLMHLGFYSHLQRQDAQRSPPPEALLQRYRAGVQRLLREFAEGLPVLDGDPETSERRAAAQHWIDAILRLGERDDSPRVHLGELPDVISRALCGDARAELATVIDHRLAHLIEDSERRIKRLDSMLQAFKKRGKPGFEPVKAGPVAVFLGEDLLRFQPADPERLDWGGGKINSQQYQILEAALAYYAIRIDEPPRIIDLLRDAGLLEGPQRHPFLNRLGLEKCPDQFSSIMGFYRAYLVARIAFLDEERRRLAASPAPVQAPSWLRLRQRSSLESWLNNFRDEHGDLLPHKDKNAQVPRRFPPLPVPENLFYRPIMGAVARALDTSPDALLEQGSRATVRDGQAVTIAPTVTWFLQHYLVQQGDGPQAMYGYARGHELFDDCLDQREKSKRYQPKDKPHFCEDERRHEVMQIRREKRRGPAWNPIGDDRFNDLCGAYRRRERRIRHLSTQDMVLFLHGRRYFDGHVQLPAGVARPTWVLEEIQHTLMDTQIDLALPVPDTGRELRHPRCKVRNLGELSLLIRDRRLPSLLAYYPAAETAIDQAEIRAELAGYRRMRVRAMERLAALERAICDATGDPGTAEIPAAEQELFRTGRHGRLLYALRRRWQQAGAGVPGCDPTAFADHQFRRALALRNAIAHNEYPAATGFPDVAAAVARDPVPSNPDHHRQVAERLFEALTSLFGSWMQFLNPAWSEQPDV